MMKPSKVIVLLFVSSIVSASDFGITGLIDIPSARMQKDGELITSISRQKIANITNITYQATPWLQTTFRYTIFNPSNSNRNSMSVDGANDRSYALKVTLLKEDRYRPELAIGIRDLLGTGLWGSEYIVASKQYGNFDFTLGMGWGRLAQRASFKNPLNIISDKFKTRENIENDVGGEFGGKLRGESFFSGRNVGVFGGFSYKVPNSNLNFLLEYNSDKYLREIQRRTISEASPISYGIKWSKDDYLDLVLSYQQGNQVGLSLNTKFDTKRSPSYLKITPFYSSFDGYSLSAAPSTLDLESWYDRLFFDLDKSGILLRKAKINHEKKHVSIEISNYRYNLTADAINRVIALSEIHLPGNISNIDIIINENGHKVITLNHNRSGYRSASKSSDDDFTLLSSSIIRRPTNITKIKAPLLRTNIDAALKFQFFDPDQPVKNQIFLNINSVVHLPSDWNLFGSYSLDIRNNFDLNRGSNSSIPHVRTEINRYLTEGSSGIESLYFEKRSNLIENLYYRFYAGILETMYTGAGFEFLYQPFKSRIAFGASFNNVLRRGYQRDFELLDYNVTTKHLSIFYASPFYNYDFALHLGKFLARDKGLSIEVRRTFDNGFSVGAFATFTDVSSSDFGEGSFDKGLFFKIPFDSIFNINSKNSISTYIRSVQRDGGQKLDGFTGKLWFDLRNVRYDALNNNKQRMIPW